MKARITNYMKTIDSDLEKYEANHDYTKKNIDEDIKRHLVQISFFQHERFVHLIVTFFFAVLTIACVLYSTVTFNIAILILTLLCFILLVPYVKHYYLLENNVQRMYNQYDKMLELRDKIKSK